MITERDLQEAIAECEGQRNPTANTCMKLAAFYAIKDKMYPDNNNQVYNNNMLGISNSNQSMPAYSYAQPNIHDSNNSEPKSEFRQAIIGMDAEEFLSVMDELMSTIKVMVPRLYDGVMRKLH